MALHHKKSRKNPWAPGFGPTGRGDKGPPSEYASPERVPDEGFIDMLLGQIAVAGEINQFGPETTSSEDSEETTEES